VSAPAHFAPGTPVRVGTGDPPSHVRTPRYIRGKPGVIERICGRFGNPERLAYGGDGQPKQTLYRVRFRQDAIWPDYAGAAQDTVDIEIYEHWLSADSDKS